MPSATYINDAAGAPQTTPVILLSGSVAVNLNPGDILIGDVHIIDPVTDLEAQIEYANTPKVATVNTLLVQTVDTAGGVVAAADVTSIKSNTNSSAISGVNGNAIQTVIMNGQGTLATHSDVLSTNAALAATNLILDAILNGQGTENLAPTNAVLTVIMNGEGTLATHADLVALDNDVKAGNAVQTVVMNGQGTLATHTDASTINSTIGAGNAILTAILNDQGSQSTAGLATAVNQSALNTIQTVIMNGQGTLATHSDASSINSTIAAGNSILTTIMNGQGTLGSSMTGGATAANQTELINQLASVINTYGSTGTTAVNSLSVTTAFDANDTTVDAFGRLRISTPDYRFDGQMTYNIPSDVWDAVWNSTGTVSYDMTNRMATLTCASSGTAVLQSHYYCPYTPGRSQLSYTSFIFGSTPPYGTARRVGYYDGSNGVYLEQTPTGVNLSLVSTTSAGSTTVSQSNWNIDRMDGTGVSRINMDFSKIQILIISFQALYSGRVVVGFDISGIFWPVHQFVHANSSSYPYLAEASLPVHYESRSTGSNVVSMDAICASVISEGGQDLNSIPGRTFSAATAVAGVAVTTRRPVLSIQCMQTFQGVNNHVLALLTNVSGVCSDGVFIEIVRNPTLTGASFSAVDSVNSSVQKDTSASALSGGSTLYSTMLGAPGSGGNPYGYTSIEITSNLLSRLISSYSSLLNAGDIITIAATALASTSPTLCLSLNWKELR